MLVISMYKMVLQDVEECPKKAGKLWWYKFTELQKSLSRLDITPEGKCLCPQLPETLGAVVEVDFFCWMCLAGNLYGPKIKQFKA